jgi:DnaJ-class molecular chaperone
MNVSMVLLLLLALINSFATALAGSNDRIDPFTILNVKRSATNEEIRRAWKQKILSLHPDKVAQQRSSATANNASTALRDNTKKSGHHAWRSLKRKYKKAAAHKPVRDASALHPAAAAVADDGGDFRRVQEAYETLKTASKRGEYIRIEKLRSLQQWQQKHYAASSSSAADQYSTMQPPYYGDFFSSILRGGSPSFFYPRSNTQPSPPFLPFARKSLYRKRVKVQLSQLLNGCSMSIPIDTTFLSRLTSSIRGGNIFELLLQGIVAALPIWLRFNLAFASCFVLYFVSQGLPRLPPEVSFSLLPGYRGGTKIKYNHKAAAAFEFILEEELREKGQSGEFFERKNDDLHTTITVSKQEVKRGKTVVLTTLSKEKINVRIGGGGGFGGDGSKRAIEGQGWPLRKNKKEKGKLIIWFKVV